MGGLEEIINQINSDSEAEISQILEQAREKCDRIKSDGMEETKKMTDAMEKKSIEETKLALEKMKSGAQIKQKQDVLRLKQELIAKIIDKARDKFCAMPDGEYFELLITIAKNNAHEEKGEIILNERDRKRIPDDFEKKLKAQGINLVVSDKTAEIDGGMILSYGDIEENCAFDALVNANRELIQDKINKYVFG